MRQAITLGIRHEGVVELLHGPDTPIEEQRQQFRGFRKTTAHPEYSEVQLWDSSAGRKKVVKFKGGRPHQPNPNPDLDPEPNPEQPSSPEADGLDRGMKKTRKA